MNEKGAADMNEAAKKVYEIARRYDLAVLLEHSVDDLEAFAAVLDVDNEQAVLNALYDKIFFTRGGYGCTIERDNGKEG